MRRTRRTVFDRQVDISLSTPDVAGLENVVTTLGRWQSDSSPLQLHPGDLGWAMRDGVEATAAAVRVWSSGPSIAALGFLDGSDVLRLTVAPEVRRDDELAEQLVADLADPSRGVLPAGRVSVETPDGVRVRELLADAGWVAGEAWTPLQRDLTEPVDGTGVRIEVVGAEHAAEFSAVVRSAFGSPRFTEQRWHTMAAAPPYAAARSLLARDGGGVAVAGVTVWSAGPGRPGLVEPMGVHADHRGRGYGRAICIAGAAELWTLGSSSALVCTPSARTGAVATYRAAGFRPLPERLDRTREA